MPQAEDVYHINMDASDNIHVTDLQMTVKMGVLTISGRVSVHSAGFIKHNNNNNRDSVIVGYPSRLMLIKSSASGVT